MKPSLKTESQKTLAKKYRQSITQILATRGFTAAPDPSADPNGG
jgi:hypothetical protein